MVSNTLKISQDAVVAVLTRLRDKHADDPEYKKLRQDLPSEWPI